jgi:AcrR family transcriptional regulator
VNPQSTGASDHSAGEPPGDGRTARAQRTRLAIVDALLALIDEGDLSPTAPRIAERAGVSLRSIYQHFDDLESLFAAAGNRQVERVMTLVDRLPRQGSLDDRCAAFLDQRCRILEAISPVRRAAMLQEPTSSQLRATRDGLMALARAEVAAVFGPELDQMAPAERDEVLAALDVAAGWGTWDGLRTAGLDEDAARRVVSRILHGILAGASGGARQ